MNSDLELLLKLQVIDYDIGELERSKEYLPDMMGNLKHEISDAQTKLDAVTSELEEAKIRQKNLELEVSTKEAELQKFQQQMMSIKTNKEYDALVGQIDSVKEGISASETELLELIDRITELDKLAVEYREKVTHVEENNNKQLEILQDKIANIGDTMSGKMTNRTEVSSAIPKPTLSVYERVRKGKGGTVVVVVKRRACGACYKALTPKKVQEIKKGDRIHTCDNCGRIMFWDHEESN
jgi:predicted  nucleic acid-binding Zn-ribbon protein